MRVMDKSIIGMSKVTRSGQIALNRKIRKEIGVEIGDYVIFEKAEDNKLYILPAEVKIKKKELQRW
jgi:AbrB family looped-hinge helix DNA binding protein